MQVQPLLNAKRWETRTAAGECIGLIAEHVQHPSVADLQQAAAASVASEDAHAGPGSAEPELATCEGMLALEGLDMQRVLEQGTPLLASGGQVLVECLHRLYHLTLCMLVEAQKSIECMTQLHKVGLCRHLLMHHACRSMMWQSRACRGRSGWHGSGRT